MKVVQKIILLLTALALISAILVKFQIDQQKKMISLYINQLMDQKKTLVTSLINIQGEVYQSVAKDYTFWDEMIDFIQKPDYFWAKDNIRNIIDVYKANVIWIFDKNGKKVYNAAEPENDDILGYPIMAPPIQSSLVKNRFLQGYIRTAEGIIEIHAATIHPTSDPEHKTEINGYFFVGKLWDKAYINQLETGAECRIKLSYQRPSVAPTETNRMVVFPLTNSWETNPVAYLTVSKDISDLGIIGTFFDRNFILYLILSTIGLVFIIFLTIKWMVIPLQRISSMLKKQNLPENRRGKAERNEFREISIMIEDFIRQRNALKQSEEKFRKLTESTTASIFIHDGERIIFINPSTEKILGFTLEELQKIPIRKIIHPDYLQMLSERLKDSVSETNKIWQYELRFIRKDGQMRWAELSSIPFENDGSWAFLVTAHDITDRMNMESELVVAKEKAEESDRLKAAFLTNLSHEIRTPMNSIIGFSNLIRKENVTKKEIEEYAEIISYSTNRLMRMIGDILEISQIETGQVTLSESLFSLDLLLQEVVDHYEGEKFMQGKSDLNLFFVRENPLVECNIVADMARVKQVLMNLLDNAMKYTLKGEIRVGYTRQPGGIYEFYISDTGIGISAENMEDVFKSFYQVDYSNKRKYSGTGLGLSITKSLVELMGGRIWMESVKGKGTQFNFTLPVKEEVAGSETIVSKPTDFDFHDLTVLVVEDEVINAKLMGTMLQAVNIKVLYAETGAIALDLISRINDIGLVLMDIQMPGMDGYECTRSIKQLRPDLPVIAQSASLQGEELRNCYKAGCDDHISKPIDTFKLYQTIIKFFKSTSRDQGVL